MEELTEIEKSHQERQEIRLALLEQLKEDIQLFGVHYTEALIDGYIRGTKWSLS